MNKFHFRESTFWYSDIYDENLVHFIEILYGKTCFFCHSHCSKNNWFQQIEIGDWVRQLFFKSIEILNWSMSLYVLWSSTTNKLIVTILIKYNLIDNNIFKSFLRSSHNTIANKSSVFVLNMIALIWYIQVALQKHLFYTHA